MNYWISQKRNPLPFIGENPASIQLYLKKEAHSQRRWAFVLLMPRAIEVSVFVVRAFVNVPFSFTLQERIPEKYRWDN
jgi:hypothetical protein